MNFVLKSGLRKLTNFGLINETPKKRLLNPTALFQILINDALVISDNIFELPKNDNTNYKLILNNIDFVLNEKMFTKLCDWKISVRIHRLKYLTDIGETTQCYCTVHIGDKEFKTCLKPAHDLRFDEVLYILGNF